MSVSVVHNQASNSIEYSSSCGIEVTPKMIEAGLKVLEDSGRLYGDGNIMTADDLIVSEVFLTMWQHRSDE